MRRTLGLAVSVAVVAAGIAGGGGSAVAQRVPVVSGTYSSGPEHAWQALPPAYVGNDTGAADATVVVDPSISRQKYTGVGFSLDETACRTCGS